MSELNKRLSKREDSMSRIKLFQRSPKGESRNMLKIAVVTGSTRPGRNNEAVARWVYAISKERKDADFELVDIADYNLPLLDEPMSPSLGQYTHEHTKVWSEKIGSFDAYVFVTP